MEEILMQYSKIIRETARRYHKISHSFSYTEEDFYQEGMLAVWREVKKGTVLDLDLVKTIVYNTCRSVDRHYNLYRRERKVRLKNQDQIFVQREVGEIPAIDQPDLDKKVDIIRVFEKIASFPYPYNIVVMLRLGGYNYYELGEIFNRTNTRIQQYFKCAERWLLEDLEVKDENENENGNETI